MVEEFKKHGLWIIVAAVLALGVIISSVILTGGIVKIKAKENVISVTGSAKKQIKSDLVKWRGNFSVQANSMQDAYSQLKTSESKVKEYLKKQNIGEKDMVFSSIYTMTNYAVLPNGQMSSQVDSYRLSQTVEVTSGDVDKITQISRQSTELINQGVEFQSNPPEYYYTKIADLKVDMLSLATKDAKVRAQKIAESTGSKIGSIKSAKMGVLQITPLYSTEVSDMGINDTSSIDKEITAVTTCQFEIQ